MANLFYLITCVISRKINILSLKMLKLSHVNMFKVIIFVRTYTTMIKRVGVGVVGHVVLTRKLLKIDFIFKAM